MKEKFSLRKARDDDLEPIRELYWRLVDYGIATDINFDLENAVLKDRILTYNRHFPNGFPPSELLGFLQYSVREPLYENEKCIASLDVLFTDIRCVYMDTPIRLVDAAADRIFSKHNVSSIIVNNRMVESEIFKRTYLGDWVPGCHIVEMWQDYMNEWGKYKMLNVKPAYYGAQDDFRIYNEPNPRNKGIRAKNQKLIKSE